jgi:hypothetical protein
MKMAHDGLWGQLLELDAQMTANRVRCRYQQEKDQYVISFLNREYFVRPRERRIIRDDQDADFIEQLCILAYLINAQPIEPTGKLVQGVKLPGGEFFFQAVHKLPTDKLEAAFGSEPEQLYKAGVEFGAKKRSFGDALIELELFADLPLTIVIWGGDEEFAARASILFNEKASQIPLDALLAAVNYAAAELIKKMSN